MNITVTPRRTVGISGYDVGTPLPYKGLGQDSTDTGIQTFTPPTLPAVNPQVLAPVGLTPLQTVNLPGSAFINSSGGYTDYSNDGSSLFSSAPNTSSTGGFNWASLLAPLTSAAGALGTSYAASQLKPGQTVISPTGQVLSGGPLSAVTSSNLMPLLLLGGGALVLVMMMGSRR